MKRFRLAFAVALSVVAIPALAGPVAADEQVPFEGRLDGVAAVSPVPGGPPTLVDALVTATGNATQLGKFALTVPHRVDRSTLPPRASGFYYFTAANGDEVCAEFNGYSMPTETPNVLAIVETATIIGGTGRFAGATGSFTAYRLFDRVALTTTGYFEGTISSPSD
jgi:hypothetical protein